ncbi:hypothetical protein JOF47_004268 [Paeniglutamicibacter kerguelensis]|uniref:Uncharacterized protein n=1 Tax=Paeniglutamicibacter kerguelensis TaxID=254788 RepID=A0ABS4XJQ2_9MICC|nr:hypothetical protein [Paeniglutamicibacter kerguelensis]
MCVCTEDDFSCGIFPQKIRAGRKSKIPFVLIADG